MRRSAVPRLLAQDRILRGPGRGGRASDQPPRAEYRKQGKTVDGVPRRGPDQRVYGARRSSGTGSGSRARPRRRGLRCAASRRAGWSAASTRRSSARFTSWRRAASTSSSSRRGTRQDEVASLVVDTVVCVTVEPGRRVPGHEGGRAEIADVFAVNKARAEVDRAVRVAARRGSRLVADDAGACRSCRAALVAVEADGDVADRRASRAPAGWSGPARPPEAAASARSFRFDLPRRLPGRAQPRHRQRRRSAVGEEERSA